RSVAGPWTWWLAGASLVLVAVVPATVVEWYQARAFVGREPLFAGEMAASAGGRRVRKRRPVGGIPRRELQRGVRQQALRRRRKPGAGCNLFRTRRGGRRRHRRVEAAQDQGQPVIAGADHDDLAVGRLGQLERRLDALPLQVTVGDAALNGFLEVA